jgi:hypothetical protein
MASAQPAASAVPAPVNASVTVSEPPAASPVREAPVNAPAAVSVPPAASAVQPAAPAAPQSTVLDLPKENITDLDSPDAPAKDLLASL